MEAKPELSEVLEDDTDIEPGDASFSHTTSTSTEPSSVVENPSLLITRTRFLAGTFYELT